MKVGVSTASLFLRKYNEEALVCLNDLGVKHAEVFLTSACEYGAPFSEELVKAKGAMNINSVHSLATDFEPQLFNLHPRAKADAYARLQAVLDSANALEAPFYTFHGMARIKRAARSGQNDNFSSMIENFEQIVDACEKRGVSLALENVEWATYNREGVFKNLAKAIPALRGVLDIKQARISEVPYENYLAEMGERLAYAHVSDLDGAGKIRLPGKGDFDFETLIKRLRDVGFDGALLIEVYTHDYKEEKELKDSCDFLNELLYKYGCEE